MPKLQAIDKRTKALDIIKSKMKHADCLKDVIDDDTLARAVLDSPAIADYFEEKLKLDRFREFLEIAAKDVICDGQNCPFCEDDQDHPSSALAKMARELLEEE